jgi:Fe-S-cluster containining protein
VTHHAASLITKYPEQAVDGTKLKAIWVRISKRRAKKINPYMFQKDWDKKSKYFINSQASFFKCKKVTKDGCTIYEDRPDICRLFSGKGMYRYECIIETKEVS